MEKCIKERLDELTRAELENMVIEFASSIVNVCGYAITPESITRAIQASETYMNRENKK